MFGDFERAVKILDAFKLIWSPGSEQRKSLDDLREIFLMTMEEERRMFEEMHKEAGRHNLSITDEAV